MIRKNGVFRVDIPVQVVNVHISTFSASAIARPDRIRFPVKAPDFVVYCRRREVFIFCFEVFFRQNPAFYPVIIGLAIDVTEFYLQVLIQVFVYGLLVKSFFLVYYVCRAAVMVALQAFR